MIRRLSKFITTAFLHYNIRLMSSKVIRDGRTNTVTINPPDGTHSATV